VSPLPIKAESPQVIPFHPLAGMFPLLDGAEFKDLAADIKKNGLREKITKYQGQILDGRNRYRACLNAKIEPQFEEFQGDDPAAAAFVISKNIRRRHLTGGQRRDLIAKLLKAQPGRPIGISPI
jgi:ParB-like chromosome segregation protein Spo0J